MLVALAAGAYVHRSRANHFLLLAGAFINENADDDPPHRRPHHGAVEVSPYSALSRTGIHSPGAPGCD
jgi:hypothetical protein